MTTRIDRDELGTEGEYTGRDATEGRPRVLVVDDDEPQREAMGKALRRAGYAVTESPSGVDAVEAGRTSRPEVAVIDVFLGDAGGLGLARALRRELSDVRVLFVTGLALPAVREALAPAPVLFKPFTRRDLLASVRSLAPWPRGAGSCDSQRT